MVLPTGFGGSVLGNHNHGPWRQFLGRSGLRMSAMADVLTVTRSLLINPAANPEGARGANTRAERSEPTLGCHEG
jgi:hypothetical protein